jgi:hypothetical protein
MGLGTTIMYVLPLFLDRFHVIDIFSSARTEPFT